MQLPSELASTLVSDLSPYFFTYFLPQSLILLPSRFSSEGVVKIQLDAEEIRLLELLVAEPPQKPLNFSSTGKGFRRPSPAARSLSHPPSAVSPPTITITYTHQPITTPPKLISDIQNVFRSFRRRKSTETLLSTSSSRRGSIKTLPSDPIVPLASPSSSDSDLSFAESSTKGSRPFPFCSRKKSVV